MPLLCSSLPQCCAVNNAQEDEALETLRILSASLSSAQLRHLNLSDNALGEKGVRAAAAALQQPVSYNLLACLCAFWCLGNLPTS